MFHLVYCSAATELLSQEAIVELLRQCRARNKQDDITGMLLYHDGSFMQLLEGEEAVVKATFERIRTDNRHRMIICLLEALGGNRHFDNWTMGFVDSADLSEQDRSAFSRFLIDGPSTDSNQGSRALKYLHSFRNLLAPQ